MKVIEYVGKTQKTYESTKKDDTYLKIAETIASLSKDQNTKVGSVIIDAEGKVVSMGYNGCASKFGVHLGLTDAIVPHTRDSEDIELVGDYTFLGVEEHKHSIYNKYPFMIHAEQNALLTTSDTNRLKGATVYCTHYPCSVCANLLAQSGVKFIKVMDNRHGTFEETIVPTLFIYENMRMTLSVFIQE